MKTTPPCIATTAELGALAADLSLMLGPSRQRQALQGATACCLEGSLDREDLERAYESFADLVAGFEAKWLTFVEPPLGERLAPVLRASFRKAITEIESGLDALFEGLACLESFFEAAGDEPDLLMAGNQRLTDFFRQACSGSSRIMGELERREPAVGSLVDVRVA